MRIGTMRFVVLVCLPICNGFATEIVPGLILEDGAPASRLKGDLIFVVGEYRAGRCVAPPSTVMAYSLEKKRLQPLMHVSEVGGLICSWDGRWVGAIDAGELSILSRETGLTHRVKLPGEVQHGTIVKDTFFLQYYGPSRIMAYDRKRGLRELRFPDVQDIEDEYLLRMARIEDPCRLQFSYRPARSKAVEGSSKKHEEGDYAFDVLTEKFQRLDTSYSTSFCRLGNGDMLTFELSGSEWLLCLRRQVVPPGRSTSVDPVVLARFRERSREGAYNLLQLSPCMRYAVVKHSIAPWNPRAVNAAEIVKYILVDLKTGRDYPFIENRCETVNKGKKFLNEIFFCASIEKKGQE